MGLHRKFDALLRGAQAAHATYSVYGADPRAVRGAVPEKRLTQRCERIARVPYGDVCARDYEVPWAARELPARVKEQLEQLGLSSLGSTGSCVNPETGSALDAGNGDALDAMIDAAVARAHFELEQEHSLRVSTNELLMMRNRGDAAAVRLQLADAAVQLEEVQRRCARYEELFAQAERPQPRLRGHTGGANMRTTTRK